MLKCIPIFLFQKIKYGDAEHGDVVLVKIEDWPKKPILLLVLLLKF
jgi:hypothetical protein